MAAYRRVYGFCHLRADCRGPGSAPEPYATCIQLQNSTEEGAVIQQIDVEQLAVLAQYLALCSILFWRHGISTAMWAGAVHCPCVNLDAACCYRQFAA